MIKCIIIDDEKASRVILRKLCSKVESLKIIADYSNALDAIKFISQNSVDVVFLDIHMPDINGFEFIDSLEKKPNIILTSSDRNFALNAFEYSCIVDYLVKPIKTPRFLKAINKLTISNISSKKGTPIDVNQNELYVNIDRRLIKINMTDIYLIEAKGDYINIKTEKEDYLVHTTLKKIEEKLPILLFLKIHRSYIINTKKIIDIEDNSVLIKKEVIPVSRANRPELFERLNLLN